MWSSKVHQHLVSSVRRNIASSAVASASTNHYDVLGITPKATQAEVKAAYYKLSKLHHPDTSSNDDDDSNKFRMITEAYEVLGNYRTRQLYDKGLYGHFRSAERKRDITPDHPKMKFYQSRMERERVPTSKASHNIYNFDEWTKQHYSDAFARRPAKNISMRDRNPREVDFDNGFLSLSALAAAVVAFGFLTLFLSDLERDSPKRISNLDKPA